VFECIEEKKECGKRSYKNVRRQKELKINITHSSDSFGLNHLYWNTRHAPSQIHRSGVGGKLKRKC